MSTDNSSDLNAFIAFANAKLQAGEDWSLDQALSHWHVMNMTEEEADEIDALVQEALDDIEAGDKGIPIDEVFAEIEAKYGLKPNAKRS
jgi:hypothetical protein